MSQEKNKREKRTDEQIANSKIIDGNTTLSIIKLKAMV